MRANPKAALTVIWALPASRILQSNRSLNVNGRHVGNLPVGDDIQACLTGPGQAGAWEATFVSASKASSRIYTFSSIEAEGNLHEGVFAGPIESYSGRGSGVPFLIAALRTDSDDAYAVAAQRSQDYIKKHPGMPISYVLEQTNRFPQLAWRVIWGASASTSDYSVFVDATMGTFIEKAH